MSMSSSKPYLIRGIYEWIVDNNLTPYILVDASVEGVVVPSQYVENGRIVLNLGPTAIEHLQLGNEEISFTARFNGVSMNVELPCNAVIAIYAKENGQGMMFDTEHDPGPAPRDPTREPIRRPPSKPSLKIVK